MTAINGSHCPHAFSNQVLPRIEAKLLATKTYQQAVAAFDTEGPPPRGVLDAHLRAIGRTSARLAFAELQAESEPEPPTPPPAIASLSQVPPPPASTPREAACQAVGQALQKARLARSLSLEQMAAQTHIQPHRIAALEAGQLAQVEDDIYLRGFIRRLAEVLALDLPELLAMLPKTPPPVQPSWSRREPSLERESQARRYVTYAAALTTLLGGLAWAAEQAAAQPVLPGPAQVQSALRDAAQPMSWSIAPPEGL